MTVAAAVHVRAAAPADIDPVTAIYREAFAGSMGVSLGLAYTRAFVEWFVVRHHICLVATVDEVIPVGFVVGAPVGAEGDRQAVLRPLVGRALVARPGLLLDPRIRGELTRQVRGQVQRRLPFPRHTPVGPAPDADACSLVGIGTRRSHRGLGVGHRLIEGFEAAALASGHPQVRLSVYRDNDAALALYGGHGWVPADHPTNPDVVFCRKRLDR